MVNGALEPRYRDRALINEKGHRDCHIRPDLVLIYRKLHEDSLEIDLAWLPQ
jgi:mRNA interferase YafQ